MDGNRKWSYYLSTLSRPKRVQISLRTHSLGNDIILFSNFSIFCYLLEKIIYDYFLTFQAFDNQVREQAVSAAPGKVMRVYTDRKNQLMTAETFIPYCSMAQAQLSFHGHRDAVKFFVSVPGNGGLTSGLVTSGSPTSAKSPPGLSASPKCIGEAGIEASSMLVMSGGEGYIDFRIGKSLNITQYGILLFFN